MNKNYLSKRIPLALLSIALSLILCEILLKTFYANPNLFYVWTPNLKKLFLPSEKTFPGIYGSSWLKINKIGLRGDDLVSSAKYYILVLGGSAAECLYLDQSETWPELLQVRLNSKKISSWVGNAGQSGRNLKHNIQQIKYLPESYPQINTVILLIGVNDILVKLKQGDKFKKLEYGDKDFDRETFGYAFSSYPDSTRFQIYEPGNAFYKKSALWSLLRKLKESWLLDKDNSSVLVLQDERGDGLIEARNKRKLAQPYLDNLPDLSLALEEYEANINAAISLSKAKKVKLVLLTQPAIWQKISSSVNEGLLWMGHAPDNRYYSESALAEGLEIFNSKLKEVALKNGITYIDLADSIPKTTEAFYDDMHFNENGARMVAEKVSQIFN